MTILKILQYPDPKLRVRALPVDNVNNIEFQNIIGDLLETMKNEENCAGLAASQVLLSRTPAPRIAVVAKIDGIDDDLCMVNPEIIQNEGEVNIEEGCMSVFPQQIYAKVKRYAKVTLQALDRKGKPYTINADGLLARCIQHEIDHLNGVLYIDHLAPLKRKMLDKKINKLLKH